MPERTLKLEVITPDGVVVSDDQVASVVAPGAEGYLGVLADHAPLMTEIGVGELDLRRKDNSTDILAVSGGFMEVLDNKVTVLAESAELGSQIDIERAEEARRRAEERVARHAPEIDMDRAQAALLRAINRLSVARHARGG